MTQIKIRTRYKKHLITTLAISSIAGNAFAEGVKDGKFFVGGSINVQQDASKLKKKNSLALENIQSQHETSKENVATATENLSEEEAKIEAIKLQINYEMQRLQDLRREMLYQSDRMDEAEKTLTLNNFAKPVGNTVASLAQSATTNLKTTIEKHQNSMQNNSHFWSKPLNDMLSANLNALGQTGSANNFTTIAQNIKTFKNDVSAFNNWFKKDFKTNFARFVDHAEYWGAYGWSGLGAGSDMFKYLSQGYNNVPEEMKKNPLFIKFYNNAIATFQSGVKNWQMWDFSRTDHSIPSFDFIETIEIEVNKYLAQNSYLEVSDVYEALHPLVNETQDNISSLEKILGIQELSASEAYRALLAHQAQLQEQSNKLEEINLIKTSASKTLPSASLIAGYRFNEGNFGFITEAGVDLTSSKVGKNIDRELEVKNIFHFYLTQKLGYNFIENNLAYITLGFGIKDYKAKYKGVSSKLEISESSILPTFIIGVGQEYAVSSNLALLLEFNHIMTISKLKTDVGDLSMRSEQVRIGARWYF
jgi:hypothetical protein